MVGSSGLPGSAHPMGLLNMHSPEQGVGRLQTAPWQGCPWGWHATHARVVPREQQEPMEEMEPGVEDVGEWRGQHGLRWLWTPGVGWRGGAVAVAALGCQLTAL